MTWRIFGVKDKLNDAGWKAVTNIVSAMRQTVLNSKHTVL
jgi:hypothetical protein